MQRPTRIPIIGTLTPILSTLTPIISTLIPILSTRIPMISLRDCVQCSARYGIPIRSSIPFGKRIPITARHAYSEYSTLGVSIDRPIYGCRQLRAAVAYLR